MAEILRPMNLGGILDRGVQIYRAQPMVFIGLAAIPGLVQLAGALVSAHPKPPSAGFNLASFALPIVLWLATVILTAIVTAALCLAASRVNLGEPVTVREAFGAYRAKAGRLVGLTILQGIFAGWPVFIVLIFATVIYIASDLTPPSPSFVVLLVILGGVPYVALFSRYALAFPETAVEGLSASASMDRSVKLSKGGRWRICGGFAVPLLASLILSLGCYFLVEHLESRGSLLAGSPLAAAIITGVVNFFNALVFTPYSAIVLTLLYYDQRIRHEGFDVERMMQTAGMQSAGLDATATPPPASPSTELGEDSKGDA
jgi:hypothetical protein